MFLHGGLLHIGGNMLYLWIFGDNVEDTLGHGRFLLFYLASGVAAVVGQTAHQPDARSVPDDRRQRRGRPACSAPTCCCSRTPPSSRW